ncbi:MAG: UDP-N-acetylmuramate--L-alanine ligase [Patescibacteria group bacterium]
MDIDKLKKVHIIGIGGIGVSAVARWLDKLGTEVSGSDLTSSIITQELENLGIKIFFGHKKENIFNDLDLVIYSSAAPVDNPERIAAKTLGIRELSYNEFLGEISKDYFTIAISGTNGKSTTTALAGLILEAANLDPTVIVGSRVKEWQGNFRLGSSNYFVVEACEWRAHMLNLFPKVIVLTNIEADHLDYYRDSNHIINTFQAYIDKLPSDDLLILNTDDQNIAKLKPKCRVITYGIKNNADVMAKNIEFLIGLTRFDLFFKNENLGKIELAAPGEFNIYNALAAIALSLKFDINFEVMQKTLKNFGGIWRRFEIIKNDRALTVVSDYAHHPTAIRETIKAAKGFFPNRRLVVIFQPHQHNRTKNLFKDFSRSFALADLIILAEIYDVAGRENSEDQNIGSQDLAEAVRKNGQNQVFYVSSPEDSLNLYKKNQHFGDVVLIMGAGDIYEIADKIQAAPRQNI